MRKVSRSPILRPGVVDGVLGQNAIGYRLAAALPTLPYSTNLAYWGRADYAFQEDTRSTPAASDGDVVGSGTDLSGNGRHVDQATTSKKPLLKLNIVNGKPVWRFDGVDDWLQYAGAVTIGGSGITVAVVGALTGSAAVMNFLDGSQAGGAASAAGRNILGSLDASTYRYWADANISPAETRDTNFHIIVGQHDGVNGSVWVDGGTAGTGLAAATLKGLVLGHDYDLNGQKLEGDVAEYAAWNEQVSAANLNSVMNEWATRYSLTWTDV